LIFPRNQWKICSTNKAFPSSEKYSNKDVENFSK
jgi:hypothetical protein